MGEKTFENRTEKIPQHHHCENCGRAFVGEGKFCSDACKETASDEVKGKLRKLMLIWVALVAVVVICVATTMI